MATLGTRSKNNLKGVHPSLIKLINEAIKETPVDFTITSGVRTLAEQKALYAQGRTKPGCIVTKADGVKNKSNHQVKADGYGHAIDLCPYVDGEMDWNDESNFKIIAAHIKATANCMGIKITWGGDWTEQKQGIVDLPHFELR